MATVTPQNCICFPSAKEMTKKWRNKMANKWGKWLKMGKMAKNGENG
jgi:hypothetical protein